MYICMYLCIYFLRGFKSTSNVKTKKGERSHRLNSQLRLTLVVSWKNPCFKVDLCVRGGRRRRSLLLLLWVGNRMKVAR